MEADSLAELVRRAVDLSRGSGANPWAFIDYPEGRLAVTHAGLPGTDWSLVLTMDSRDIYYQVMKKVVILFAAIALLALAVSSLAYLNIRPLVGYLNGVAGMTVRERSRQRTEAMKE